MNYLYHFVLFEREIERERERELVSLFFGNIDNFIFQNLCLKLEFFINLK
jgi:hypothetical protein